MPSTDDNDVDYINQLENKIQELRIVEVQE